MNFILKLSCCFGISIASFIVFVSIIGPMLARIFNWKGNDHTALFGPEWIWNYGFYILLITFFASVLYFGWSEK